MIDATTGFTTSTWYVRDASGNIMATYEKTEYTVLDTSAITLSVLNNLVVTDWGAHVFSRFMEEAVEIHELMDAGDFTSLKGNLTTTSQLETALRMLSPILILPLESTLMDDVLFDYSYSDFYTAMLAYYGSTTAYGNALQSGCKSALITHFVGTYYNSNNFVRTLFTNHNTLAQAVWSHFQPLTPYPGASGAAAFLKSSVTPVTDLYNYIGTTFDHPSVNIVTEFTAVLGTSVLGTAISSFMSLKPCTRTIQGDLTMFGILDLYDRTELWDQMIANSSVSSLADMMIDHAPGKFVQAAIELNPTRANTLFSGLDPMNTYHVTDYLNAILNYTAFGSSYYQDIVNQLMTLGYVTDGWNYSVSEHHIYGSSRVGVHKTEKELRTRFDQGNILVTLDDVEYTTLYRGKRHYELSNHLGNVQVIITDKRISVCDGMDVESFKADVLAAMDYYPFGMMMPDRQWYANSDSSISRFGFNGQEKDDEVSGIGNELVFEYRVYDSRLGRFFSVDPLEAEYSWNSPYAFAENDVISCRDLEGLEKAGSITPPSMTTSAFIVYNYRATGGQFYVTYQVFNGTPAQAAAAAAQNAENGGNGQIVTAELFRAGMSATTQNRNWNYLTNPGFAPAPDVQKNSSAPFSGGLTPTGNGNVNNFAYNTTPVGSVPPSPTAVVTNATTQTVLTIDYDLKGEADRIVVMDATGAELLNFTTTGKGTVSVNLPNAVGNLTIFITPSAGSNEGSYVATVETTVVTTYLDPGAAVTSPPGAVPTIPTTP